MVIESNANTTLVMVDDDEEDVLMLRTAARRAGHEVRILHLAAGSELLDAFSQSSLPERCVVLLDLNMPALDGFAVLERLRRLPHGELLPVVVFTSSADQVHVERAFASGANAYLTKPSSLKETSELMGALVTHWLVHGQVPQGAVLANEQTVFEQLPMQRLLVLSSQLELAKDIRVLLRGVSREWKIDVIAHIDELAERLNKGQYDVWLVDHELAEQASDLLATVPIDDCPPVVLMTARGLNQDQDAFRKLGAVDSLSREELRPGLLDRTLRFAISHWRSQRALERSQTDLLKSERLATIGRMASGVAHEYNNLNAIVLAGLERLDQHITGDPSAHQMIDRILGAIERSRRISESLMTIGRPADAALSVINLQQSLADTLALLDIRAKRLGAVLRMASSDTPCMVRIDANDLHQVVTNLVVNAFHAVHAASDPSVVVSVDIKGEQAILSVTDNGVGIPAEDMPQLFQPFFSRKAVHSRNGLFPATIEGTGLGLSVCQVLIERVGGKLTITSREGVGTKVTIALPLIARAMSISTMEDAQGDSSDYIVPQRPRVVVLDDNHMLCQMVHEVLSESGFDVHSHVDPKRFLAEEPLDEIDFLVLDWQMPGLMGSDVLMRLGNPKRKAAMRVLVASGERPQIPEPLPPGVTVIGVILKPYRVKELISKLTGGG